MTRSMAKAALGAAAVILLVTGAIRAQAPEGQAGPPPLPPARKIPGINAAEQFPGGCVGCHVKLPEMDVRLSTLMKQWQDQVDPRVLAKAQAAATPGTVLKGKHPVVAVALGDIPAGCLTCHGSPSEVGLPFAQMLHVIHLTGGEENHFMTLFQGECTHCHKLNQATGRWTLASGPEQ